MEWCRDDRKNRLDAGLGRDVAASVPVKFFQYQPPPVLHLDVAPLFQGNLDKPTDKELGGPLACVSLFVLGEPVEHTRKGYHLVGCPEQLRGKLCQHIGDTNRQMNLADRAVVIASAA